jgi:transposase-like protein
LCVEVKGMSDEQGMVRKGRRTPAEIEQIVSEYESSGLNRSQFCRGHGLRLGILNRYLKRLRVASEGGASGGGLVAVELAGKQLGTEQAGSCGLAVVLRRGRKIAVSPGFDSATLQRLVQVLETM